MKHAGRPIGAGTAYYLSRTSTSYGRGEQNDYSMDITAFDLSQPFWHNMHASRHQWWQKEYEHVFPFLKAHLETVSTQGSNLERNRSNRKLHQTPNTVPSPERTTAETT